MLFSFSGRSVGKNNILPAHHSIVQVIQAVQLFQDTSLIRQSGKAFSCDLKHWLSPSLSKTAPLGANSGMEEDAQAKQAEFGNTKSVVGIRVYSSPHAANHLAGVELSLCRSCFGA